MNQDLAPQFPDLSSSDSDNLLRYAHLVGEISGIYHEISVALGISDSTSMILYTLCCGQGQSLLSDICRLTGLSKQTLHSSLRQLEKNGLLRLEAVNGKSKRAVLTDKGQEFADRTSMQILRAENNIFRSWTDHEMQYYLQLTARFRDSLASQLSQLQQKEPSL